ncbi:hypothetical protein T484DRAFT_2903847 [Baffinella frigidus]|nr:hypothetical protein T484DRAFT_2903847 [Cryptophyta sp. CCMP2293]
MGDYRDGSATERERDLLAGSVSKAILAQEVLRLKQLREELLTGGPPSSLRIERLGREIREEEARAARESIVLEDEILASRELLLDARDGGGRAHGQDPGARKQGGGPSLKEQLHHDAAFLRKLTDLKTRLSDTSIEHASPLEKTTGEARNFFRSSNARLRVVSERIDTVTPPRALHSELLSLLRDNARLRVQANDFAEGLLAEAFESIDRSSR